MKRTRFLTTYNEWFKLRGSRVFPFLRHKSAVHLSSSWRWPQRYHNLLPHVTQEDEADEFQSYCLPDFVLIQVLEDVEEELELVGCKLDLTDNDASNVSSLTQLVEDDCRDTTFEQDSAERKRLISHVLQMRASLERYLNQKLARQPRQPRMLIQIAHSSVWFPFKSSKECTDTRILCRNACDSRLWKQGSSQCICPARTRGMLGSGRKVFGFEG
jgi:hypothetical protein